MLNIVFGSLKTTNNRRGSKQEFDYPSVKLEASRGPKTSRRILFNNAACELLGMSDGYVQELLFGYAETENGTRLFVVNTDEFANEVEQKTYKTSKNRVSYHETSEKGKAISSKPLANDIMTSLNNSDDTKDIDFHISLYTEAGTGAEANVYECILGIPLLETLPDAEDNAEDIEVLDAETIVPGEELRERSFSL